MEIFDLVEATQIHVLIQNVQLVPVSRQIDHDGAPGALGRVLNDTDGQRYTLFLLLHELDQGHGGVLGTEDVGSLDGGTTLGDGQGVGLGGKGCIHDQGDAALTLGQGNAVGATGVFGQGEGGVCEYGVCGVYGCNGHAGVGHGGVGGSGNESDHGMDSFPVCVMGSIP